MKTYTYEELERKVDIILSNIVDGRDINLLCEKFDIWLSLEWASGTIEASDFSKIRDYAHDQIALITNCGLY